MSNATVRRITLHIATTSLSFVALVSPARAQDGYDQPLNGNIGIHGGYAKAQSAESGNALGGGVHLEFMPVRVFGIQGAVDYRSEESFDVSYLGNQAELNVRTIPITVSGKLYAPIVPRFQPYGLVGAGWYHQVFDFSENLEMLGFGDRDETTFAWHVELGASALMGPRFGAFAEAPVGLPGSRSTAQRQHRRAARRIRLRLQPLDGWAEFLLSKCDLVSLFPWKNPGARHRSTRCRAFSAQGVTGSRTDVVTLVLFYDSTTKEPRCRTFAPTLSKTRRACARCSKSASNCWRTSVARAAKRRKPAVPRTNSWRLFSHELRSPLQAILGWSRILRQGDANRAEAERALEIIDRSATMQVQLLGESLGHEPNPVQQIDSPTPSREVDLTERPSDTAIQVDPTGRRRQGRGHAHLRSRRLQSR